MASTFRRTLPSPYGGVSYLLTIFLFFVFTTGASAFGAGTTSSDDCKWRHGDIENALLGLMLARTAGGTAFTRMDVKRVYFGNWLRDYSQIMDVAFLKVVGPNVLRTLVALFAFMTFGYGTGEFEVSDSRLSVYRPEEHLDNPKNYANNIDAKKYDSRLRGVVDEDLELFPDDRTGMKGYIANERLGVTTTAGYVRKALGRCIKLGRQHARKKNIKDFDDALRHLGAALHALEDFPAHSNYIELCIRELGERGVFPHVGTATEVEVKGEQVFPLVTGSFGTVHFLSSVVGGDPMNPNLSELQLLEQQILSALETDNTHGGEIKVLRDLFEALPKGLLNEQSIANLDLLEEQSKEKQKQVQTRADDGEPVDLDAKDLYDQIYPFLEMHDRVVREIVYGMEEVPSHAATYEKIQQSLCVVTFTLIAPYILPVLQQARIELAESANELIAIASEKEGEVFSDPYCSDPVHTVISKDSAANVLSEPAGRIAVEIVRFVVPLVMRAWDEPDMDMEPLINYIIGVFHHPVCRDERNHRGQSAMFAIVRDWWTLKSEDEKDELRGSLSMDGIKESKNHHGHDTGHGSSKPIAGIGVMPGDATGTIFTEKKPEEAVVEEEEKVPEVVVEKALEEAPVEPAEPAEPAPEIVTAAGAAVAADTPTPMLGSQDGRSHRRKRDRDSRTPREREDRGSRSPEKRENRRSRRHNDERSIDREPPPAPTPPAPVDDYTGRDPNRRKHRSGDPRNSQNEFAERERHHHHRHRDEAERAPPEEKQKDGTKSRLSAMFSSGFNYLGFGGGNAPADAPGYKVNGSAERVRSSRVAPNEERHKRYRHRHEGGDDLQPSPPRHRSSRRRERSKSDEDAPPKDEEAPPVPVVEAEPGPPAPEAPAPIDPPDSPEAPPAAPPEAATPIEVEAEGESDRKPSRRRSSRKREGHRSRREGGDPSPIPEEGSGYFQPHHPEHELRPEPKSKASKVLGMGPPDTNGESARRNRTRRHTDREPTEKRRVEEPPPPSRGGLLGRIMSKRDKFLGREQVEETPRPIERRRTGDRGDHTQGERRKHHSHDEDERRRRRHRSMTLPVQIDPTDFADGPPAGENGIQAEGEEGALKVPDEKSSRNRKHRSSPSPLHFDAPSDGSGSDGRKPSRSPRRRDSAMPELQDVSGLGIDTGDASDAKAHRRRHRRERDWDETPTPSPRKKERKRPVKEVNFEDAVESGDAPKKEKARRHHRPSREESREAGDGSAERRRRERRRESGVFGGYEQRE
ncbi:hypothetical protein TWF106_011479 [Orbilia oligospora]|uniref:Uncharacterized protein n=1 Tax=Orbilia oligospora TaxID=2813651 RepID=A0A7C8UCP1_ORBOL|nr:hypothetical protein TWF106_011479 [Orbilia oligospora]